MSPSPRRPSLRRRHVAAVVGLLVGATACGPADDGRPGVDCTVLVAPPAAPDPVTASDSLDVIVALPPRSEPVEALVRVDPIGDDGLVVFPGDVPPTAAGVGATLTVRATWSVCVSSAPRAVVYRGEDPPHDKVWIRVSTDRPVRATLRLGDADTASSEPPLVVLPGASGRMTWSPAGTVP